MPVSGRGAYSDRLDDDYWAYIERANAFFPSDALGWPLDEQRRIYDRMCRAFHPGRPGGLICEDTAISLRDRSIPIRRYRPERALPGPMVLFFHGGGFVFGGLESHDDTVGDLCVETGIEMISVDYRLAPEHPHPASFEDALAAFDWLAAATSQPIILLGESAGGTLAAAVVHAVRGRARVPAGQLLIYPSLGGEPGRSHREHAQAPLLTTAELAAYRDLRSGGQPPMADPSFEPLSDTSFADLPATVVVTAECDPLSSEGEAYRDRIIAAGGDATWREEPRLTHSFLRARPSAMRARQAFERLVADLGELAGRGG